MRVIRKSWRGPQEMELNTALTVEVGAYDYNGALEHADALAALAAKTLANLLTVLVERGVIDLETAGEIVEETLEPVNV